MARHHKSKRKDSRMGVHEPDYGSRRYSQESRDGSLIQEDHSQMANLPRGVMYKKFPVVGLDLDGDLEGNILGIDRQMNEDAGALRKIKGHPRKI